jgi:hypothetical protein
MKRPPIKKAAQSIKALSRQIAIDQHVMATATPACFRNNKKQRYKDMSLPFASP